LLDVRNRILGSLRGGQDQTGSINQFAKALADKVNGILEAGTVDSQAGADKGVALFVYDTPAASTIKVNPAITAAMLAPANASGSNGAALELAGLGSTGITELGGTSLVDFFGNVTAAVGAESAASSSALDSDKQAVAQMRTLRDEISGVSLDEQAVLLLQFQRSYAAAARVLTVLDQLTETTINLVR
jgi:flagellar hook-associated protein 1 FlgK